MSIGGPILVELTSDTGKTSSITLPRSPAEHTKPHLIPVTPITAKDIIPEAMKSHVAAKTYIETKPISPLPTTAKASILGNIPWWAWVIAFFVGAYILGTKEEMK